MFKYLLSIIVLLPATCHVNAQQCFDLYSGNVPVGAGSYYFSMESAKGWLYSGKYFESSNGSRLAENSRVKKEQIDSLHKEYMKLCGKDVRPAVYIPRVEHTEKGTGTDPYLVQTFYVVKSKIPTAAYQVKVVFSTTQHNERNDIVDILIVKGEGFCKYDRKMLMAAYNKEMKEEARETPPPMQNLRK